MPSSSKPVRILFIGNSFTARNDVPGMLADMARQRGCVAESRLISAGGASLRRHWNAGEAVGAIREGKWGWVVLQEQSTLPVKNAARMHENVRLFAPEIRSAGARPALYLTWARRHAPKSQAVLTEAYESIAREIGATVVPVGVAWERFLADHEVPVLHDRDGSHPTLAGSYLAACVFLRTLLGERPVGLEGPGGLDPAHARLLQEATDHVT